MRVARHILCVQVILGLLIAPCVAKTHAIIVGFNDYPGIKQPLQGALADVADLKDALQKRGVDDVVSLDSVTVSTKDFRREWSRVSGQASPGDLIIVTFSGHGIKLPEIRRPRRTPDGFDKGFLFPSYDEDLHPDELLRDEDLYDLFKVASDKGQRVLFIVDACHAGNGLREIRDPRTGRLRFHRYHERADDKIDVPQPSGQPPRPPIPHVIALTAQIEEKSVPEVQIDGEIRGALSYAVARAFETDAARSAHEALTIDTLFDYVRNVVRVRSDNQQAPVLFARTADGDMPIFSGEAAPPSAVEGGLSAPDLAVFGDRLPPLKNVHVVRSAQQADVIVESNGRVVAPSGDLLLEAPNLDGLQGAVDGRRLILALRKAAELHGTLATGFHGAGSKAAITDDGFQVKGSGLTFDVPASALPFLTVFDISADGTTTLLFPIAGDDATSTLSTLPKIYVQPPYGADSVVFLRTNAPLAQVQTFFASPSCSVKASDLLKVLFDDLRKTKFQVGIQGLYTCASLANDGKCNLH